MVLSLQVWGTYMDQLALYQPILSVVICGFSGTSVVWLWEAEQPALRQLVFRLTASHEQHLKTHFLCAFM